MADLNRRRFLQVVAASTAVAEVGRDARALERTSDRHAGAEELQAQPAPNIEWDRTFGDDGVNVARSIVESHQGGYLFAGQTGPSTEPLSKADAWLVELTDWGEEFRDWTYDERDDDWVSAVVSTSDGHYLFVGGTSWISPLDRDLWVVKVDDAGEVRWRRTYGGEESDFATSAIETSDGGYLVAGGTGSSLEDSDSFRTSVDAWVMKLDTAGRIDWSEVYPESERTDYIHSIIEISDGGFVFAGTADFSSRGGDGWVAKLSEEGEQQWSNRYDDLLGGAVVETSDGGYLFATQIGSLRIVKLQPDGEEAWTERYDENGLVTVNSILETDAGTFLLAGRIWDDDSVERDAWLMEVDETGERLWRETYGNDELDAAHAVVETPDLGYLFVGRTGPYDRRRETADTWVVKLRGASTRIRALVPPVFPTPGESLTAGALLESDHSHESAATVRLYFDGERVAEESVSVVEGVRPVRWWPDVSLTPGRHNLRATVEAEWLDGTVEKTRMVDVPPLTLTEVYTQPATLHADGDDADTDDGATETVLEVENPTENPVTATFSLYTAERNGPTDNPEPQGDPDQRQEVTLDAGETARLYFQWELDSEATHRVDITMGVSEGGSYLYRDAYSPLGIPLPTEIAYAAGTAPRGSGHSIQTAELVYHKDIVVAQDWSAVYIPMSGDGRNEIVVYDENENVIGQTEQSVDTTVEGTVMEMVDRLDPNDWVEVPIEVDDSTRYLIIHAKEEKGPLWAIGKGFLSGPLSFARAMEGLAPVESPKTEHGGTETTDPNALRYEHVAVAELSGYPQSADLRGFSREVGDREAADYHWETAEQAVIELPTVVTGFVDATVEVISTIVSVATGIAEETMDEITDAFGVHVSFSELAAGNDEGTGKLTVYDYGTDDPKVGVAREELSQVRGVDVKTTGLSEGTADVTVHYDDDLSHAGIGEGTLALYYWNGESWEKADDVVQDTAEQTVGGTIDVPDLTGTPVVIFGDRSRASDRALELPGWVPLVGGGAVSLGVGIGAAKYLKSRRDDGTGQ